MVFRGLKYPGNKYFNLFIILDGPKVVNFPTYVQFRTPKLPTNRNLRYSIYSTTAGETIFRSMVGFMQAWVQRIHKLYSLIYVR